MISSLSNTGAAVLMMVAQALMPAPEQRISDWVDEGNVILGPRTNSPKEGPVSLEGVEYLREPLNRLHPDDPCTRDTVVGGAQSGKSLLGQLWVAWSIANNPKSFAIGLPSEGEVGKYSDYKLQPIIDDSPLLKPRVRPISTKASLGSSARKKILFNGASILIFNLSSPKELQMISTGNLILEEVSGTLKNVGERGSPVKQARERQAAYSSIGSKELMVSTPRNKGDCEITAAWEAGDMRLYYGLCPACGGHFVLLPEGFKPSDPAWGHHFICPGCGVPLQEKDMPTFRKGGIWVPSFTSLDDQNPPPPAYIEQADIDRWHNRKCEGRQPSYYVWQAMFGLISWAKIAQSIADALTPEDQQTLSQQVYGRAWDPAVEALEWEELHKLREQYDTGVVPSPAEVLTGMCDVQGNYLQWSVFAWAPGAEWWVVDRGIIEGDTAANEVWHLLDEVVRKRYRHAAGGDLPIAAFGVDSGHRTQRVYSFCRGRQNCFALDGRPDWKTPYLGKARAQRIIENGRVCGRVKLWPTGTWQLKSLLSWSLKRSIEAGYTTALQGRGHWSMSEDEEWCRQITAEILAEETDEKSGKVKRWWKKIRSRNEETDIWVGARALAWNLGVGAPRRDGVQGDRFDWAAAKASRVGVADQSDLLEAVHIAVESGAVSVSPVDQPAKRLSWV